MEAQLCKSEVSATWNNGTSSLLILTKHIVNYILWQSSKITRAPRWHFLAGLQATGLPPPGDLCPQLPAHLVQLTWRSESCHHHHRRRRSRPLHHHPLCLILDNFVFLTHVKTWYSRNVNNPFQYLVKGTEIKDAPRFTHRGILFDTSRLESSKNI